jgi:magnesium transporter
MTLRARLYDARGNDRDLDIARDGLGKVSDRQLVWIDLDARTDGDLARLADVLKLEPRLRRRLADHEGRPRLDRFPERFLLTLNAVDRVDDALERRQIVVLVGRNLVVTVHEGRLPALDEYEDTVRDERDLGALNAGAFMAGLVDAVVGTYFREVESIERAVDTLDDAALRARSNGEILRAIVALRHRIAVLRRTLTPNRDALLPLARPDFEIHANLFSAWPGTIERLERAIDAVENARELLVGSFDIYLGRAAQRSNDVMKTLTLVSAIALPAIVLAGVMGMNFKLAFFEDPSRFWIVVGAMVGFAAAIVAFARVRRWI